MMWWALQTMVITAAMAALIAAVGRWARLRPAALHLLWLLVLVRFVVPPVLEWPWPLASPVTTDTENSAPADERPVPLLRLVGEYMAPATPPSAVVPSAEETGASRNVVSALSPIECLLLTWVAAACVMAALQFVRLWRIQRILRHRVSAPEWMQDDANALAARIGTTPPAVDASPTLPVPVYWNLGGARLIVPQRLIDTLDRDAWNAIFLHELAHHKRHDHWAGWLEIVAGCLWWWNPVFWYARRRLREQAELACDAWVISEFPDRRRVYADALLHVFESVSRNAERRLAWSMAADIRLGFERRLKMIYASHVSRNISPVWVLCSAALLALVTPAWTIDNPAPVTQPTVAVAANAQETPETGVANTPPSSERNALDELLDDAIVSIEFENEHLSRICGFLAEYVGTNIVVDARVVAPAPGKPESIPNAAYVTTGVVPYIKLNDVSLRSALGALCRPQNLDFDTTAGFIWISSPGNLASEHWSSPPSGPSLSDLEKAVAESSVSIEFEDEHISRIMDFLGNYLNVNIVVDSRVVAPAPEAPGKPSAFPAGINTGNPGAPGVALTVPDAAASPSNPAQPAGQPALSAEHVTTGRVAYIKLLNVSLHQALEALLRPLNLAYRVESDFIWISSPEKLATESFK